MVEQKVSILTILRDQVSAPLIKINDAFILLQKNLRVIDKTLVGVNKGIADLTKRASSASTALNKVNTPANKFEKRLKVIKPTLTKVNRGVDALRKGLRPLVVAFNKAVLTFKKAQKNLRDLDKTLTDVGRKVTDVGRRLLPLSAAIGAVGIASVKFAADFDKAITQSTSIIRGLTAELDTDLRDAAKAAARDVPRSAAEIAESFFFLASAGLSAEQSIAALPAVLDFAIAGQFDLSTATDLSTDALSALGLASEDATENLEGLTRVTDVLVRANVLANATVSQFSEALTNRAGASLRLFNKDIEEGVAALTVFADQGVKGARAGQFLFQVLRDLSGGATRNAAAFEKLQIKVFGTDGEFRNLADVIEDIEKTLKGLNTEQKKTQLSLLGIQERSLGAILQLVGFSEQIRINENELRTMAITAKSVADKQLQNLSDQFFILVGRLQLVAIELGESVGPALDILFKLLTRGIDIIGDVVDAFGRLSVPTRVLVAIFAGFLTVLAPVLIVSGALLTAFGGVAGILATLATAIGAMIGPFLLLLTTLGLTAAGIVAFADDAEAAVDETEDFERSVKNLRLELIKLDDQLQENSTALSKVRTAVRKAQIDFDKLTLQDVNRENPVVQSVLRQLRAVIDSGEEELRALEVARDATAEQIRTVEIERAFRRLADSLGLATNKFEAQKGIVNENRLELERAEAQLRAFEAAQADLLKVLSPTDDALRSVIQNTEDFRREVTRLRKAQREANVASEEASRRLEQQARATKVLADANKVLNASVPGLSLVSISKFSTEAIETLRKARQEIAQQLQAGLITTTEALALEADALLVVENAVTEARSAIDLFILANQTIVNELPEVAQALNVLNEQLDKLDEDFDEARVNSGDFFLGVKQGLISTAADFNTLQEAGAALGATFANELTQGITDVFIEGRKSFSEFATDFLKTMATLIVRIILFNTLAAAFGGASIFTPNVAPVNTGGWINKRGRVLYAHEGSMVPGGGPNRDTVPAMLTPGEYVHNRDTVDYYGPRIMQAMNRRMIPRDLLQGATGSSITSSLRRGFQTGGQVGGGGGNGSQEEAPPTPAFVIANEQTAERIFAGGVQARRRMLEEEADLIRGLIGGQI